MVKKARVFLNFLKPQWKSRTNPEMGYFGVLLSSDVEKSDMCHARLNQTLVLGKVTWDLRRPSPIPKIMEMVISSNLPSQDEER